MSSSRSERDDDIEVEHHQFKVILLGDGAVGKTSISLRFAQDHFSQIYKQTVGVDFFIRRINLPPNNEIALQLWDIGGQSIGSKMISNYISGAHAVLLCYDITNFESFANLEDWYRIVTQTFAKSGTKMPYVALVGNKFDLRHLTAVRIEQHNRFAEENELSASFLLSAKSGDQVMSTFHKIAASLAGVELSKAEAELLQSSVVEAKIIDHKRHDETVNKGEVPDFNKNKNNCNIS